MKPTQLTRPELVTDAHRALHALIWNGRQRFQAIVKDFGLTGPQASFLMHVHKRGPVCSMGEVTDALQLIASTSTSVADRLVERGLIERGINPDDRRVVEVSPHCQRSPARLGDRGRAGTVLRIPPRGLLGRGHRPIP